MPGFQSLRQERVSGRALRAKIRELSAVGTGPGPRVHDRTKGGSGHRRATAVVRGGSLSRSRSRGPSRRASGSAGAGSVGALRDSASTNISAVLTEVGRRRVSLRRNTATVTGKVSPTPRAPGSSMTTDARRGRVLGSRHGTATTSRSRSQQRNRADSPRYASSVRSSPRSVVARAGRTGDRMRGERPSSRGSSPASARERSVSAGSSGRRSGGGQRAPVFDPTAYQREKEARFRRVAKDRRTREQHGIGSSPNRTSGRGSWMASGADRRTRSPPLGGASRGRARVRGGASGYASGGSYGSGVSRASRGSRASGASSRASSQGSSRGSRASSARSRVSLSVSSERSRKSGRSGYRGRSRDLAEASTHRGYVRGGPSASLSAPTAASRRRQPFSTRGLWDASPRDRSQSSDRPPSPRERTPRAGKRGVTGLLGISNGVVSDSPRGAANVNGRVLPRGVGSLRVRPSIRESFEGSQASMVGSKTSNDEGYPLNESRSLKEVSVMRGDWGRSGASPRSGEEAIAVLRDHPSPDASHRWHPPKGAGASEREDETLDSGNLGGESATPRATSRSFPRSSATVTRGDGGGVGRDHQDRRGAAGGEGLAISRGPTGSSPGMRRVELVIPAEGDIARKQNTTRDSRHAKYFEDTVSTSASDAVGKGPQRAQQTDPPSRSPRADPREGTGESKRGELGGAGDAGRERPSQVLGAADAMRRSRPPVAEVNPDAAGARAAEASSPGECARRSEASASREPGYYPTGLRGNQETATTHKQEVPADSGKDRSVASRDMSDIDRRLGELHEFLRRAKAGGICPPPPTISRVNPVQDQQRSTAAPTPLARDRRDPDAPADPHLLPPSTSQPLPTRSVPVSTSSDPDLLIENKAS